MMQVGQHLTYVQILSHKNGVTIP